MKVSDISINNNKPIINTPIDLFVQEINILFDTIPGEVLGDVYFGTDFEKFIWDLSYSNTAISKYIQDAIGTIYISRFFDIKVNTTIMHGSDSDIILVQIDIRHTETGDTYSTVYRIN